MAGRSVLVFQLSISNLMKNDTMMVLREQTRFYISTPEKAAEALLFVRELEKFAEEVKAKVKERTVEIMDRENKELIEYSITDPETGEVREWEVKRSYGTVTKEYRPENVYDALGEDCFAFMKVEKGKLETFLKKASAKGDISMDAVSIATKDPIEKTRKGAGVIIREKKA